MANRYSVEFDNTITAPGVELKAVKGAVVDVTKIEVLVEVVDAVLRNDFLMFTSFVLDNEDESREDKLLVELSWIRW